MNDGIIGIHVFLVDFGVIMPSRDKLVVTNDACSPVLCCWTNMARWGMLGNDVHNDTLFYLPSTRSRNLLGNVYA
jgi:hypothetical protein